MATTWIVSSSLNRPAKPDAAPVEELLLVCEGCRARLAEGG